MMTVFFLLMRTGMKMWPGNSRQEPVLCEQQLLAFIFFRKNWLFLFTLIKGMVMVTLIAREHDI